MKNLTLLATQDFDTIPEQDSEVIRKHSQSFSTAALLLPAKIRGDAQRLYAWCRWCDDAVDNAEDVQTAQQRLNQLRHDVDAIFAGEPTTHAASQWLASIVRQYPIPREIFHDLLDGMEMDIHHQPIVNVTELELYCYRAAGTVGIMMAHLLGASHQAALEKAKSLGIAMQMTNIARDVREDQERGRCYLPKTWLEGLGTESTSSSLSPISSAVKQLLDTAEEYYNLGFAGLKDLPQDVRPAIWLAAKLYREIGIGIARTNYQVMDGRYVVPRIRKLPIILIGLIWLSKERCIRIFK